MDSVAARDFWNSRYDRQDYLFGETPNAFLAAQIARLQPGMTALAVADGEGRNGVWLAEQGLAVTTTDIAPRAVEKALALAWFRRPGLSESGKIDFAGGFKMADEEAPVAVAHEPANQPQRNGNGQADDRECPDGGVGQRLGIGRERCHAQHRGARALAARAAR